MSVIGDQLRGAFGLLVWAAIGGLNVRTLLSAFEHDNYWVTVVAGGSAIICIAIVTDRYRKLSPVEKKE